MTSLSTTTTGSNINKNNDNGILMITPSIERMNQLKMPFPWKLHHMLEEADRTDGSGFASIVSWLPDGKAFQIYQPDEFVDRVMRQYFNQSKLKSFTRQLYIYGFLKIPDGPYEGAFFHPEFVRENKQSCFSLRRNQAGDRRRITKSSSAAAASRRGSTGSQSSAGSCETWDSQATSLTGGSASPVTVTSATQTPAASHPQQQPNMTQIKQRRRNSLSEYVAGRPTTPSSSHSFLMPPPPMRNMMMTMMNSMPPHTTSANDSNNYTKPARRSSMSNLPRAPSNQGCLGTGGPMGIHTGTMEESSGLITTTTTTFSALKPTYIPSHSNNSKPRRNSLSDFFDHALNLLPADDAYATLPCLESLMMARQQQQHQQSSLMTTTMNGGTGGTVGAGDASAYRATSIGMFDKQDLIMPTPIASTIFSDSSIGNTGGGGSGAYRATSIGVFDKNDLLPPMTVSGVFGDFGSGGFAFNNYQQQNGGDGAGYNNNNNNNVDHDQQRHQQQHLHHYGQQHGQGPLAPPAISVTPPNSGQSSYHMATPPLTEIQMRKVNVDDDENDDDPLHDDLEDNDDDNHNNFSDDDDLTEDNDDLEAFLQMEEEDDDQDEEGKAIGGGGGGGGGGADNSSHNNSMGDLDRLLGGSTGSLGMVDNLFG